MIAALIPPLILAKMIDSITSGKKAVLSMILLYFVMLAVTGGMESAREGLLTVLGQKITHALRSSLMDKFTELTTDEVNEQELGAVASRFVGDVDTCAGDTSQYPHYSLPWKRAIYAGAV